LLKPVKTNLVPGWASQGNSPARTTKMAIQNTNKKKKKKKKKKQTKHVCFHFIHILERVPGKPYLDKNGNTKYKLL